MSWLTWFARSSFSLGTRFGMVADAAGFQNCDATPARNFAMKIHVRFGNSGIETKSRPRIRSPTIIVTRRSNLSASAPAIGPRSNAGSSVTTQTPPVAAVFARLLPFVTDGASQSSARMDSQSPRLDSDNAIQSARKGLMERTPPPERARLTRRLGGASPGLALRGVEWEFTALGYRSLTGWRGALHDRDSTYVRFLYFFGRESAFWPPQAWRPRPSSSSSSSASSSLRLCSSSREPCAPAV